MEGRCRIAKYNLCLSWTQITPISKFRDNKTLDCTFKELIWRLNNNFCFSSDLDLGHVLQSVFLANKQIHVSAF